MVPLGTCSHSFTGPITGYLLGNIFGAYLYGALTVQLYRYYISFPKDPKLFKVVIYIVYVTETVCTVLLVYELSTIVAKVSFEYAICINQILAVCGGIVAFLIQSMYTYRIQIITKLKYMSWVIILVMALQLFAIVTITFLPGLFLYRVIIIWTSMSLFIDVTITSVMVWFLRKDEIYSKQLKRKIARLIYLIIGTGFLTAATNLCILVLLFYSSKYCIGLLIVLSKLYANSMMVLVNSRIPSARSEINHRATLDMITVRLSPFHATTQVAPDAEHGQRGISVDSEARASGVGLSAPEAEGTTNDCDLTV